MKRKLANYQDYILKYIGKRQFSLNSFRSNQARKEFVAQIKEAIESEEDPNFDMEIYDYDEDDMDFYIGNLSVTAEYNPATWTYDDPGRDYDPRDGYTDYDPEIYNLDIQYISHNGTKYPVNKEVYDIVYNAIYKFLEENPQEWEPDEPDRVEY